MANKNFVVQNGLTVGPLTIDAATGNLTTTGSVSIGTQTSIVVSGAITVNSSNAVTAIINGGTTGVGNIGSSTTGFNTVFAQATSAQYADVAERYQGDAVYEPGTVLSFGGGYEVTLSAIDGDTRVAGVVSTNPAYIMNDGLVSVGSVAVALLGRVPCKVQGKISKGDMLVSAGNGRARTETNPSIGAVIGKALENNESGDAIIEVVVGVK